MAALLPRETTGNGAGLPVSRRAVRRQRMAGVILVLLAALTYLATLDTGLQPYELHGGDLITHQYAQVQARPSNAPGYPLYTMGGWLWYHGIRTVAEYLIGSPVNPIPILSSYSTLWALLSIWLLYAIVCRLTRRPDQPAGNWPLAWLLAAFYAVTYFFWYYATTTEQYSSAIAQTLAIVYVYLLWRGAASVEEHSTSDRPTSHATRLLFLLAFLCGLSLAHMLTIAFIVPPLVIVILWQRPDLLRSPKAIVGSVIAAALPLVAYTFVYVRGAAHPEWWGQGDWPNARAWFFAFLSTAQGREELGWGFEPGAAFLGNGFPELIWHELSLPLLILGLLGILLFDRKLATLLFGAIGLTVLFSWAYRYGNWYQVILPAYPLILLGNAAVAEAWRQAWKAPASAEPEQLGHAGVNSSTDRQVTQTPPQPWGEHPDWPDPASQASPRIEGRGAESNVGRKIVQALPLILLAAAIVWRAASSLPAADSRQRPEDTALNHAAILLDQDLPAGTPLFAAVDDALALQYLIDIWGVGGNHRTVSSLQATEQIAQGQALLATLESTPILLEELHEALPDQLSVQALVFSPDWVVVEPAGDENAALSPTLPLAPLSESGSIPIIEGITLVAFAALPGPQGIPGVFDNPDSVDLSLIWQIDEPGWPDGLAISVRPTAAGAFLPDPAGESGAILQVDRPQPVAIGFPGSRSDQPSTLLDAYRIPFPPEADGILLILYRPTEDGFENLAEIPLPVTIGDQSTQ